MKYLSVKLGPALAVAAILSLAACTAPMGMQGCNMNCCAKMHCCKMDGKEGCCKSMHGCCCCCGDGSGMKGCPYTPKAKH
jgi:hypothetical protein